MSVAVPFLFAIATIACAWTIWRAVAANLAPIAELKRRASLPDLGAEIYVNLRENEVGTDENAAVRYRRARHSARPKPIIHRLHHFTGSRSAA